MAMTPRERVEAALNKEELDRPPVAIFTQSATVGQMDKTGAAWPEAHKDPRLMATLAAAQADMFGFECCRACFCLTAEAERLGCKVQVEKKDAQPMIKGNPANFDPMSGEYDDPADVLKSPEYLISGGRTATIIEACSILQKECGKDLCVVAGNTGPFTLAGHLCSTENLVFGMMMAPEEVKKWVSAVTPLCTAYSQALIDNGADIVQMSEPSASTDMLAPDMFHEASGFAIESIFGKFTGKSILHICGNAEPILDQMAATGVTGLSVEEKVDAYTAVREVGNKTVLVGNVGSVRPLFQGSAAEVKEGAENSCKAGFDVISSGCGVAPATSNENMQALVDAVKNFSR